MITIKRTKRCLPLIFSARSNGILSKATAQDFDFAYSVQCIHSETDCRDVALFNTAGTADLLHWIDGPLDNFNRAVHRTLSLRLLHALSIVRNLVLFHTVSQI
jgi:hypothetical protein